MTVKEDLISAAEIMQQRGRCEGVLIDDHTGRCCPLGAIGLAVVPGFEQLEGLTGAGHAAIDENPRAHAAVTALAHRITCITGDARSDIQIRVWFYNDCEVESDQEMIDTILAAADKQ